MIIVPHRYGSYTVEFLPLENAISRLPANTWIITDENVQRFYGSRFSKHNKMILPPGEETKSFRYLEYCLEQLAEGGADRATTVVALGGGVIGDLAGFVASAYMRGVPYVQIPTTLLAQVDSSVGGKVGIDLHSGKNLAGAFYPPKSVFVSTDALQTLDIRQFNNGMAEVWKYGFIFDSSFADTLHGISKATDEKGLQKIIMRCLTIKKEIVEVDEFETSGVRAILNYGHTVGHALEQITSYTRYLHGEAIAIGMYVEAKIGEELGITEIGTAELVKSSLHGQGLPTVFPRDVDRSSLIEIMKRDKKRSSPGLALSLLSRLGTCKLVTGIEEAEVLRVLNGL